MPDVDTARKLARLYKATPEKQRRLIELVTVVKPARLDSRLIMQARVFAPHGFDMYDSRGVCIGTKTATALTTGPGDVADHEALFTELEKMAVYDDDVRTLISRVAGEYQEHVVPSAGQSCRVRRRVPTLSV